MDAQKRIRVNWKIEGVEKTFLEACIEEVVQNGRDGASLKAKSWKNVAENLKTEHAFFVDQKQMKNRYDYLKSKFSAWSKLKNKTGNVYDPVTNNFNLSEEEWQLEIKSNKFVEPLRRAPLEYPDLCVQLFEGSTSNGFASWGPSSTISRAPRDVFDQSGLDDIEGASEESPDRSKRTKLNQGVNDEALFQSKKPKSRESMNSKILEMGNNLNRVANMLLEKQQSNDMEKCLEKLTTLGWEKTDPKYQTALLIFAEGVDMRKMFLLLDPEICEMWIKNAGGKYNLL